MLIVPIDAIPPPPWAAPLAFFLPFFLLNFLLSGFPLPLKPFDCNRNRITAAVKRCKWQQTQPNPTRKSKMHPPRQESQRHAHTIPSAYRVNRDTPVSALGESLVLTQFMIPYGSFNKEKAVHTYYINPFYQKM